MIMKTIKNYIAFLMLATMMVVSCDKENGPDQGNQTVEPNFPDLVENYEVTPGETLTLSFTPNYDWKLSVVAEQRHWFLIKDGSFTLSDLYGYASSDPIEAKIVVTDRQEFDKNFSCEVTLTMDGQSKVIAKYMLPAKERTLDVTSEQMLSDVIALEWSAENAAFMANVKVESNTEWTVETPEWLDVNVPEKTTGIVDLVFTGESLEAAEGTVVFKAGDSVLKEVKVSVPSCMEFEIYTAVLKDGEFEFADGGYAWNAEPASEIDMVWLGADFRVPVNIDAKCNWSVELPEWLQVELPEVTAGVVSTTLMGVPSKYPLTDTKGEIVFKYGETLVKKVGVNMPGCQDIMTFTVSMSLTELDYNYIGEVNTSTGYISSFATAVLTGVKNVRLLAVETTGAKVGNENPEWFTYEMSNWDPSVDAPVLQDREIKFSVTENTGDVRSAVFFVLPPSVTAGVSELFNEDASVKAEYAQYALPVRQASMNYDDYITVHMNPSAEFEYSFEKADEQKAQQLTSALGATEHVYVLTYSSPYCRDDAYMSMPIPYASYKVFSADDLTSDKSDVADFWLAFVEAGDSKNFGVVDMYSNEMPLPEESTTGYVVFYNSEGGVLAIVECVSPVKEEEPLPEIPSEGAFEDEDGDTVENADSYFVDKDAALKSKATIVRVVSTKDRKMKEEMSKGTIVLKLTMPADTPVEVALSEEALYYQMPYALRESIKVNGENYGDTQGQLEAAITKAAISMTEHDPIKDTRDYVKFHTSMSETYPFMAVYLYLR